LVAGEEIMRRGLFPVVITLVVLGCAGSSVAQITTTPSLSSGMTFQVQSGGAQGSQNVTIYTPNATTVFVTVPSGQTWLKVDDKPAGVTFSVNSPTTIPVQVNTLDLTAGQTLSANVTLAISGQPSTLVNFPVSLTVGTPSRLSVNPANIEFVSQTGAAAPGAQTGTVTTTGNAPITYTASALLGTGGKWLSVGQPTGMTPGSFTLSVNQSVLTTLGAGTWTSAVQITPQQSSIPPTTLPVTLIVTSQPQVTISPYSVTFNSQAGTTPIPSNQSVTIYSAPSAGLAATTSSSVITLNPVTATTTPATLSIGLNSTGLAGLARSTTPYAFSVTVTLPSLGLTATVPVNVDVVAPDAPVVGGVGNAGSGGDPFSPGEIVSIYGSNLGGATPLGIQLAAAGKVATTLGNTTVTIGGVPAPLTYVSSGQINAVVPYEVAGLTTAPLVVSVNGVNSPAYTLTAAPTAPGIFADSGANGQGAILNQDGSVNGISNPAAPGSVIVIYATGEGQLNPAGVTGSVTPGVAPFPEPVAPVQVIIGGQTAQIDYAGEAPGFVSGVLQVNAVIPAGTASGPALVVLTVGGVVNSGQAVTVAVQ
jgi:uncharacterized protein (TIGR03437 family)